MRSSRFQSFTPPIRTTGLWRLKTALSPSSANSSNHSYTLSGSSTASAGIFSSRSSSTSTTSPLSMSVESHADELLSHSPGTSSCCSSSQKSTGSAFGMPIATVQELPGHFAPVSARSRLRMLLMRRRKQSIVDLRLEEEQRTFSAGLRLFEPRPKETIVMGGIFEVLEGKF